MSKKILVTGASGFLGYYLCKKIIEKKYSATGIYHKHPVNINNLPACKVNIINRWEVTDFFDQNQFDFIFHLAYAKDVFMKAAIVNGTEHILREAKERNIPLLFMSSDLIFDGEKGNYSETDEPDPVIDYGKFKLEAEKIVEGYAYIVRTSLIFDSQQSNIMKNYTVSNLCENKPVNLFIDEFRSPIEVRDLADGLMKIMENKPDDKLWHIAGPQQISRYKFGEYLAEQFMLDKNLIKPASIKSFEQPRPKNTSLNSEKFYNTFFKINSYF